METDIRPGVLFPGFKRLYLRGWRDDEEKETMLSIAIATRGYHDDYGSGKSQLWLQGSQSERSIQR